jgi:hypothetical protein
MPGAQNQRSAGFVVLSKGKEMAEDKVLMYLYRRGGSAIVEKVVNRFGKKVLPVLEVLRDDGWVVEEGGVLRLAGEVTSTPVGSYGDGICLTFHAPVLTEGRPSGPQR